MLDSLLKEAVIARLRPADGRVGLFAKGRVGFYAILKAMGVGHGDEVVIPAYTCVVVPNALKYLDATPRYVDIDLATFASPIGGLTAAINSKTKAVVCQNTYGLSFGVDEVASQCKGKGVWTIEDCTHGFGGGYRGKPNGTWCDAAFFSSQWNKPFSSGVGGYTFTRDKDLGRAVQRFESSLQHPSLKTEALLWLLLRARRVVGTGNYHAAVRAYRFLSRHNVVPGSSSGGELRDVEMPGDYLRRMGPTQMRAAIIGLARLAELNVLRKENGKRYTAALEELSKNHVDRSFHADHLFLKYPLLVEDRSEFVRRAEGARIPLGDWFCSPLHPIEGDLTKWDFDAAKYPNAVFAAHHVVNLPTDTKSPQKVIDFVAQNADLILPTMAGGTR